MPIAVRDGDEVEPGQPAVAVSRRHAAVRIDHRILAGAELMRGDGDQFLLELLRGMERGAAEHDRHAAADRRIARHAFERIRPHHADPVGIDFENFADHGCHQRLVALPGRGGVDGGDDIAQRIDMDAAGFHPGAGRVLRIEQRLERRIAAARLEARGDADAGQQPALPQPVALGLQCRPIGVSRAPWRPRCDNRRCRSACRSG